MLDQVGLALSNRAVKPPRVGDPPLSGGLFLAFAVLLRKVFVPDLQPEPPRQQSMPAAASIFCDYQGEFGSVIFITAVNCY